MQSPLVNICIPTYNRDFCIGKAVDSALNQTYENFTVTVVDDGSSDGIYQCVEKYFNVPNFCYIRLQDNAGTAQAKNVAIMFSKYDAITFHDSDDIADKNKILLQARALNQQGHIADSILNWRQIGHLPENRLEIDLAITAHTMIKLDGSLHYINKALSLVDDFFPNLQFPSKTEGDWILINSALFRKKVFQEIGGYLDSVEEDRELRNRLISTGYLAYFIEISLLTKIEMGDSLTTSEETGYKTMRRRRDREKVWDRLATIRRTPDVRELKEQLKVKVDLSGLRVEMVSNPDLLTFNKDIPHIDGTDAALRGALSKSA